MAEINGGGAFHQAVASTAAEEKLAFRGIGKGLEDAVLGVPLGIKNAAQDLVGGHVVRAVGDLGRGVGKTLLSPLGLAASSFNAVESIASFPIALMKKGALGAPGKAVGSVASGVYNMFIGSPMEGMAYGNTEQKLAGLAMGAMCVMPIGGAAQGVDGAVKLVKSLGNADGVAMRSEALRKIERAAVGDQDLGYKKALEGLKPWGGSEKTAVTVEELSKLRADAKDPGRSVAAVNAKMERMAKLSGGEATSKEPLADFAKRYGNVAKYEGGVFSVTDPKNFARMVTDDLKLKKGESAKFLGKTAVGEFARQAPLQIVGDRLQTRGDKAAAAAQQAAPSGKSILAVDAIQTPSVKASLSGSGRSGAAAGGSSPVAQGASASAPATLLQGASSVLPA